MPNMTIQVNTRRAFGPPRPRKAGLAWLANFLQSIEAGKRQGDVVAVGYNDALPGANSDSVIGPAIGMLVGSGGAGSVGGTIGGTAVTVTFATSDTVTAGLLAAAIRANSTVNKFVTASNISMAITLASVTAGQTVIIGGQTFTAVATASVIRNPGDFNIDGSDTQDAAALALAINRHPSLAGRLRAVSSAGAVIIFQVDVQRSALPSETIQSPPATITITRGTPTAGPQCAVLACPGQWGPIGNFCTVVASGTGETYVTNGTAGQLGNGTGGGNPSTYSATLPTAAYTIIP